MGHGTKFKQIRIKNIKTWKKHFVICSLCRQANSIKCYRQHFILSQINVYLFVGNRFPFEWILSVHSKVKDRNINAIDRYVLLHFLWNRQMLLIIHFGRKEAKFDWFCGEYNGTFRIKLNIHWVMSAADSH